MNSVDLRLKLLGGDSLYVNDIEIKPLNLRQIKDFGFSKYQQMLYMLVAKKEDLVDMNVVNVPDDWTTLDLVLKSGNVELIDIFANALLLFVGETEIDYHPDYGIVVGNIKDLKIINGDNFEEFVHVIKLQNSLIGASEEDKFNPSDNKAKAIADKLKQAREKLKKVKKAQAENEGADIDFADIVSAVSTRSNTFNKLNIWDCTIYQLYDEYKRLEMIVGYETNVLAMVNGATIEDMKHWSSKIND